MGIIPGMAAFRGHDNNWHYLAHSHSMSVINLNICVINAP